MANGMVLMDASNGDCFELNRVGAEVWNAVVDGKPIETITRDIAARYDVSLDQVAEHINRLLDELTARKIVRLRDPR